MRASGIPGVSGLTIRMAANLLSRTGDHASVFDENAMPGFQDGATSSAAEFIHDI